MEADDPFHGVDDLMSEVDFAALAADLREKQRRETAELLLGLLPVLDGLEALEAHCKDLAGPVPDRSIGVLVRQMRAALAGADVTPLEAVGRPLDLSLHDVEAVRFDAAAEPDTVLEERVRGYRWGRDVLRRARVVTAGENKDKG